jgi:type II secretory pathway pseudopilin PulG
MTYDITPIVQAVFALVGVLITSLLIPWIRSKTTAEQQEEIKQWVKIAVAAAEQIFVGSGRGKEKKDWVLEFLAKYNLKVDMDAIDALIEAAVWELNNM